MDVFDGSWGGGDSGAVVLSPFVFRSGERVALVVGVGGGGGAGLVRGVGWGGGAGLRLDVWAAGSVASGNGAAPGGEEESRVGVALLGGLDGARVERVGGRIVGRGSVGRESG